MALNILIAGDFSPKERVMHAFNRGDRLELFPGIDKIIRNTDYSIVNFESVIPTISSKPIYKVGSHLSCNEKAVDVLKSLGFKMVTLANNHFKDYGEDAMWNTVKLFRNVGIETVGVGNNIEEARKFGVVQIKDKKTAIINVCEHEFSVAGENRAGCNPIDLVDVSYDIKKAKDNADYVILIIHGGIEHYQLPSPRMKKWYRFFIDQGADAVINHHQHCFSGFEEYKGKPIFYGLGNLCFDSASDIKYRHETYNYGYMVRLKFEKENIGYELIPYEQCYKEPIIRLFEKGSEEYLSFDNKIAELNDIISNDEKLEESFNRIASKKKDYVYGFMRPYSSRIMNSLYYRGLLPSFLTNQRKIIASSIINCETHRDALIYNLLEDTKRK